MNKKWYTTWWGIILILLLLPIIVMGFLTNLILKQKWTLAVRISVIIILWSSLIISASLKNQANKNVVKTNESSCIGPDGKKIGLSPSECEKFNNAWKNKPQDSPTITTLITPKSMKITEYINNLIVEKYPNFEVIIWNENSEIASEGQIPYEVIFNGSFNKTIVSSCDGAKKLSYYILENFYKDNEIRPILSRVIITIPYYLRVSLGANDGVPMELNGSFSGPTNFWGIMEKMGLGENENGEIKNRTWGNYLTKCK